MSRKKLMRRFIFFFLIFLCTEIHGQTGEVNNAGVITGVVFDSAYNIKLQSATVAVYAKDSSLVQYGLTNHLGAFNLGAIPFNSEFYLFVSHTGYTTVRKMFRLDSMQAAKDFKNVNLFRNTISETLKTVVVKSVIPVRINGDTLEFNADAFKLDKNAVVEDLLKKLPAITVWGDGVITVNGKRVANVYVDGKPFFGSDPKIAIQNLDKGAVDKIQVYNRPKDEFSDTLKDMNIVLKSDKKNGYFGKVGAGRSINQDLYDADVSFNRYSPKNRTGAAGNYNSINKNAGSLTTLFLNNTYKAGITDDYKSDFTMTGENTRKAAGFQFWQDILKAGRADHSKEISGDYFYSGNKNKTLNSEIQTYNYKPDSVQRTQKNGHAYSSSENQRLSALYNYREEFNRLNLNFSADRASYLQQYVDSSDVFRNDVWVSRRVTSAFENNRSNAFGISGSLDTRSSERLTLYKGINVDFSYNYSERQTQAQRIRAFSSLQESADLFFDRKHEDALNQHTGTATITYDNIGPLLFGRIFSNTGVKLAFQNTTSYMTQQNRSFVEQYDTTAKEYLTNGYLSNLQHYQLVEEAPGLTLLRSFLKKSENRYAKVADVRVNVPLKMRYEQNRSEKGFQNYSRSYLNVVPSVSFNYTNNRLGKHQQVLSFDFVNTLLYPTWGMLVPLVDSTLELVRLGNTQLMTAKHYSYKAGYIKKQKDFFFSVVTVLENTKRPFTTNTIFDSYGRQFLTYSNARDDNNSGRLELKMGNAYKLKHDHQIQIQASTAGGKYKVVNYFTGVQNIATGFYSNNTAAVYYNYKSIFNLNLSQYFNYQSISQSYLKTAFKTSSWIFNANLLVRPVKQLFVRTDLRYARQQTNTTRVPLTIWNSMVGCRFLEKQNLEITFSAMDILRQNRNVRVVFDPLSTNIVSTNMLQQYFMVSVAFFPRKTVSD